MYSRFAAGKKTRTEMATEKPNLPASEEQISPAAEDVIAACEATDGVADPEMPAAAEPPVAEAAGAESGTDAAGETAAGDSVTETAAEEVAGEVPAGEAVRQEDAPRPRRARIRAAAEPVEAPQEEDAPEEVQVDFSDEDAALAARSAGTG